MPNKILGIDPGYGRLGIAIIESASQNQRLIYSECFETNTKLPHPDRLLALNQKLNEVISEYQPQKIALETLLWSKNKKTALQVAEARGVILLTAKINNLRIYEYNPNQIKLAITGYGKSDKTQIIAMVKKLIKIDNKKRLDDEYDAIAIALTCDAISLSTDRFV
jgi:crossover junction endodeoxyribonuclease RuvC